jgi:bifunctional non-homologous end joining protein LigD
MQRTNAYHCQEQGSDKLFYVTIAGTDTDGYQVLTQYGPRGGRMTDGAKTKGAVPLADAEKVFAREHKVRLSKGYRQIEGEAPVSVGANTREDSGLRPQLLNIATRAEVEALILDDAWFAQVKYNGERLLLDVDPSRAPVGINRKGQVVAVPREIVDAIIDLNLDGDSGRTVFDGERIGTTYVPFDLLWLCGEDIRQRPAEERIKALLEVIGDEPSALVKAHIATTAAAKRAMLAQAEANAEEGIVLKRKDAPYSPGRPHSGGDQRKFPFLDTATVRIAAINGAKRSVAMEVRDGTGAWIGVGNVTILPNFPVPAVGTIGEVRYMHYNGLGGALYQPLWLGTRHDVDEGDCTLQQLKHKGVGREAA